MLIDPKGRDWNKYNGAYLVKPNLVELEDLLGRTIVNKDDEVANAGKEVMKQFNFKHLLITRGKDKRGSGSFSDP
ncbi:MAG: hypothetical protein IPO65_06450 [Saprospiraceae bacterium]|nr:hypothetical protein [Saprospiraceae bacterium]